MAQAKVRMCKYDHGRFKNASFQNFIVNGNTEGVVKDFLQKKHPNEEIVVRQITWA